MKTKNIEGLTASQSELLRKSTKKDVALAGAGPFKTARSLERAGLGSITDSKFQVNATGRKKAGK